MEKMMLNDVVCGEENSDQPVTKNTNEQLVNSTKKDTDSNNNDVVCYQTSKIPKKQKNDSKTQGLGVRVPKITLNEFRNFVVNKHGKLNGVFAQEVDAALRNWMYDKQHHTTNYDISLGIHGVRSDVHSKHFQIAKKLAMNGSFPYFSAESIKNIVRSVIGDVVDARTYKKYLRFVQSQIKEENKVFGLGSVFDVTRFYESVTGEIVPKRENIRELSQ